MRSRHKSLLIGLLLLASSLSFSHDDILGTRYVATTGVDEGKCDHAHDPCRTIAYAIRQMPDGGTVKVAEGLFSLEGLSIEDIFGGKAGVMGGFSVADDFAHQDPKRYVTQVHGLLPAERNRLAARGLYLIVDAVATLHGRSAAGLGERVLALQEQNQARVAAANCVQGLAGNFPCRNIDLLAQVRLADLSTRPGSMSNLWGFVDLDDGREYAVVGVSNATVVIDVTDPENPREVGSVPGNNSLWREVKVYQFFDSAANQNRAYAYITTEAVGSGLQVIELTGLPNSVSLVNTIRDFQTSHTLYVSNVNYATNATIPGREAFLYIAGSNIGNPFGSFLIYDLDLPGTPRLATQAPMGTGYMHDSTSLFITDQRTTQCDQGHNPCEVLVDFNETTVDLWDVTDKGAPVQLSSTGYPEARYTHSGWPTEDQRFIFVFDELDELRILGFNTHIYTLDIGDLRTPRLVTSYIGPDTTTDHNGYVKGDRLYVSHYRRGLVVFDITDPEDLREVGNLDTFTSPAANEAGTIGAWGVYPFLPSGIILVSDIDNGLFILRDNTRNLSASAGRVGFAVSSVTVAEGAGLSLSVRRTAGNQGAVSVDYATVDGGALAGSDYTAASGTLSWAAGDELDKVIVVPITDDTVEEAAEQFSVALSNLTGGATIDGSSSIGVTISANDTVTPPPSGGGGGGGRVDILWLLFGAAALGLHSLCRLRERAGVRAG